MEFTDNIRTPEKLTPVNERTKLNAVYISLNFDSSGKPNKVTLQIADTYMQRIGFGNQPYLVYQPNDAGRPPIHNVTINIQRNSKRIKPGIVTEYKYKGQSLQKQGISFKMGEYRFKGSKIDRRFSYASVEKTLALKQEQLLQKTQPESINMLFQKPGDAFQKENTLYPSKEHDISIEKEIQKAASDLWKSLTGPVGKGESLPKELREEQRKRKQR